VGQVLELIEDISRQQMKPSQDEDWHKFVPPLKEIYINCSTNLHQETFVFLFLTLPSMFWPILAIII
jgi:hypothetical protein